MVSGSLISCDSLPQSFGRCDITAHWAPTCPKLWLRIASATLTPELCVLTHSTPEAHGVDFLSALFVMGIHLRRLLGRTHLDRGCSSWPGSNTARANVCFANMRQRLPSTNSIDSGHKPVWPSWNTQTLFEHKQAAWNTSLEHLNCVWTQANRLKHKSETLELCLNTVCLLNPSNHPHLMQRHSTFSCSAQILCWHTCIQAFKWLMILWCDVSSVKFVKWGVIFSPQLTRQILSNNLVHYEMRVL